MRAIPVLAFVWLFFASVALAAEHRIESPGGGLVAVVSDAGGLHYRVEVGGQTLVVDSHLGLGFKDGTRLGPSAVMSKVTTAAHDGWWRNDFGSRRQVRDGWREARLMLTEQGSRAPQRTFGLIVRAYEDGVAFRYDLPKSSGLGRFVLTDELTEVRFAGTGDDGHRVHARRRSRLGPSLGACARRRLRCDHQGVGDPLKRSAIEEPGKSSHACQSPSLAASTRGNPKGSDSSSPAKRI